MPLANELVNLDELISDSTAILEKDDINVDQEGLAEVIDEHGDLAEDAHRIAYLYLTLVDGSYSEEEARTIAWF